jgi:hypothetical protein
MSENQEVNTEKTKLLGILGSIGLIIGVFTPIANVSITHVSTLQKVTYFNDGRGDGVIVLILGIISLVFTINKMYKYLWITGGISGCIVAYTIFTIQAATEKVARETDISLKLAPVRIHLDYGFIILLVSVMFVLMAPASTIKMSEPNPSVRIPPQLPYSKKHTNPLESLFSKQPTPMQIIGLTIITVILIVILAGILTYQSN